MQTNGINVQPAQYYPPYSPVYTGTNPIQNYQFPPYGAQPSGFQRPAQQMPQNYIPGRTVASSDEITPQEIPMDGSLSLFPKIDQSCVYGKSWNPDGTIKTVKFVPEIEAEPITDLATPDISDVLQEIIQRLNRIEKNMTYQKKPNNYRGNRQENAEHDHD